MNKKSFKDIDVTGKLVFVRVDFNVPLDDNNNIIDDTRIISALPTIKYLVNNNAKVILCSHLGRPKGAFNDSFSMKIVHPTLERVLGMPVKLATDVIGESAKKLASELKEGEVMLLENVRFHKEEEANDEEFSKELASLAEIFVLDAFGTAHRAHASTAGIARYIPAVAGFLVSKEVTEIERATVNPTRPSVVIFGGKKVSDKIGVISTMLDKANSILIGGAMAFTFIVAQGGEIGLSRYEKDKVELAKQILEMAEKKNVRVYLPVDSVVTREFSPNAKAKVVDSYKIPADCQSMDIGPKTRKLFAKIIKNAKTVIWNGPMGVYEFKKFQKGTVAVAKAIAKSDAISVVGGGDSAAAVNESGYASRITHISTGGGATLELLEGKDLPGIAMLNDKED
ncbi:MAG: phosphoglycerate kinase [Clostridia bacterium]|nr:phosphoglycerate kinase [Clostridia bacterium]